MTAATEEIDKIRFVRRKIAAECGNDPHRLVGRYVARAGDCNKKIPTPSRACKVQETPDGD